MPASRVSAVNVSVSHCFTWYWNFYPVDRHRTMRFVMVTESNVECRCLLFQGGDKQ